MLHNAAWRDYIDTAGFLIEKGPKVYEKKPHVGGDPFMQLLDQRSPMILNHLSKKGQISMNCVPMNMLFLWMQTMVIKS